MSIEGVQASGVDWSKAIERVIANDIPEPWWPRVINLAIIPKSKRRRRKRGRG